MENEVSWWKSATQHPASVHLFVWMAQDGLGSAFPAVCADGGLDVVVGRIAARSVSGTSRISHPTLWRCCKGSTVFIPFARGLKNSVRIGFPFPVPVQLRGTAFNGVPRPYKVPVRWKFIGGYLGNPFYAISPHFIPLTRP